jgi:hypothetical protein
MNDDTTHVHVGDDGSRLEHADGPPSHPGAPDGDHRHEYIHVVYDLGAGGDHQYTYVRYRSQEVPDGKY